jgi:uncharacterized OsmC-like protein
LPATEAFGRLREPKPAAPESADMSIADTWNSLSAKLETDPSKASAKYASATAKIESGLACIVTGPGGETIKTDMAPALGGTGSHPNPGWYFRAAMAACCSTVIAAEASRRGIDLTSLAVTIEAEGDTRGMLGTDDAISAGHSALRTNVQISAKNASRQQLDDLVAWAAAHSPVGCTVRDAAPNTLNVIVD